MPTRSLRRHLDAEGTSFRQLLEEAREALAEEMLTSGLTVEQTARRLGYNEPGSFSHAFRRWTGIRPADYSRTHRMR